MNSTHLTQSDLNQVWPITAEYRCKKEFGEREFIARHISQVSDRRVEGIVAECALGAYQLDLLTGQQVWSGADLVGKAGRYRSKYAASRAKLLTRIDTALAQNFDGRAFVALVFCDSSRRWRRELVVEVSGGAFVWSA
jgi:hypothetical protein